MIPSAILAFIEEQTGVPRPDGLLLYGRGDLAERNDTFEVAQYLSGYLLIGDDSGGRGVFVSCTVPEHPVYLCDLGSLADEDFIPLAGSLDHWVESECPLPR
jgi:hypothetical protein